MMVFVSPGFRFYPTRSSGTVRYAIGGQFIMAFGKGASNEYVNGTNRLKSRSISGIALSNSLHFHMSKYVRAGIAVSLGVCADNGVNSAAGANKVNPFGQVCFSLGGRF